MKDAVYYIVCNLDRLPDEDIVILADEVIAERRKRCLLPKTHEPGYLSQRMKDKRERAKKANGKNYDLIWYRKQNNLTQKALAERLGILPARIGDYELGVKKTPEWIMEYIRKEETDGPL